MHQRPMASALTGIVSWKSVCTANQTARLRTTPTTAAVIAESAALERLNAAKPLDERSAEENPKEARGECYPGCEQTRQASRPAGEIASPDFG